MQAPIFVPHRVLLACVVGAACLFLARPAHAQSACLEDDAGLCSDDAGSEPASDDDAGSAPEPDGGPSDAGADGVDGFSCSCESNLVEDGERIHVCTESFERDVCADLQCDTGRRHARACPARDATHCCEMPSRGLYTALYSDCTHPNCESGFRAQCEDFGGSVVEGACPTDPSPVIEDDDGGGGLCSVGYPRGPGLMPLSVLLGLPLLLARRRQRRR